MSERGVFAVARGIWTDPDFADEPFSEREAFLWLVSEAAWRPTRVRIGHHQIELARGQCAFSTRFMAEKWKWSEARVRRYLGRLISAEIICTRADKIATHITIQKYDRFQRVSLPDAEVSTHARRTSDAPATHLRRKEEDRENTSLREEVREPARKHVWPADYRDQVWERYGKKVDKVQGMAALDALHRADRLDWTELISGIDRQAGAVADPKFRPSLERFIKRQKWTDQPPTENDHGPRSSDLLARRTSGSGHQRSSFDAIAAGLADVADRRGLRSRGGESRDRPGNAQDHRSRPDDPGIEDAEWSPAGRYHAAHH